MSYTVIRLRASEGDPTRWDRRTKTIIGTKGTLGEACDLAFQVAGLPGQERSRFLIRRPDRKHLLGDGPTGRLAARGKAR